MVQQLSIFLENKKGHLTGATKVLSDNNINMHALVIAENAEYGLLRVICDAPKVAAQVLEDAGYRAIVTDVTAVKIPNTPGALSKLLASLDDVNIEYAYCFANTADDCAIDVLKINDDSAHDIITKAGFEILDASDVYAD